MAHIWFKLSHCIKCNIDRDAALYEALYKSPKRFYESYLDKSNIELIDAYIPCISDDEWIIKQALE